MRLFPVRRSIAILLALVPVLAGAGTCAASPTSRSTHASTAMADRVVVVKSERRLYLVRDGTVTATYAVSLGRNPIGQKYFEGDGRTPEGLYRLSGKNEQSRFYRSIRISYPSQADRERSRKYGGPPGGNIMIHGQPGLSNASALLRIAIAPTSWTDGCIAVENWAMDEIWAAVDDGTPIEILP
jgi:murein L,D-transpeptidase YafK